VFVNFFFSFLWRSTNIYKNTPSNSGFIFSIDQLAMSLLKL